MPPEDPDSPAHVSKSDISDDAAPDPAIEDVPPRDAKADAVQAIDDLDDLLSGASFEDPVTQDEPARKPAPVAQQPAAASSAQVQPDDRVDSLISNVDLPQFDKILQEAQVSGIELLRDVNLDVKIELGRSRMRVENVLKLVEGSVVELDRLAGDPVDVYVNDRLVARGEVLVLDDNFCVRVNEIVQANPEEDL